MTPHWHDQRPRASNRPYRPSRATSRPRYKPAPPYRKPPPPERFYGFLTHNEMRARLGLPPLKGGEFP